VTTVILHGAKAAGRVAYVDDADLPLVSPYRWTVWESGHGGPYAIANINRRIVKMHRLITGQAGMDHIDRDGLNNRRSNLRPATMSQNIANTLSRGGSSRFKGVSWDRVNGRWRAAITIAGQGRNLGRYASEEEAARAYDAAALAAWGEYARLNFPREVT